ncbi:Alpha-1,3/1,6-mannosyltransferase ALG2 [Orchesella cincta]|uniref:Alpha-1,3/1,6-mannosyltransferase ALG2 n=1 Tax=Orchesella cincta TaxID=48709 RepID=A0A1D2M9M8_ORCCI|nr:Alpha-1,3/1,6-mannosyltransferase ALG2 [Orchesella cincta]
MSEANDVPVSEKGRVAFIHPDLGLGGAERLIVDAAVGLKRRGYEVTIYTGYHNPSHAFPETVDGTLKVVPVCQWLPRTLFGRCIALCSYVKMTFVALYISLLAVFSSSSRRPQVIVCDQVSACIPALKLTPFLFSPRIMFYCHFPDLLQTSRSSLFKRVYRAPLDFVEELTTGLSDKIVVNSLFTKSVFQETFTRLRSNIPDVLYPSINTKLFDEAMKSKSAQKEVAELKLKKYTFLSVNRFERKKNLALAIRTLRKLGTCVDADEMKKVQLVLAGGYDSRLEDSVKYLEELKQICKEEGVVDQVKFVLSPKDDVKVQLISKCVALLYTPSNEHFGIVPLEAMYMGKPVLAVDSGGPRETVVHEVTGFLCPSNEIHFAAAMATLITEPEIKESMGNAGKARFKDKFSFDAFSKMWDQSIEKLISGPNTATKTD